MRPTAVSAGSNIITCRVGCHYLLLGPPDYYVGPQLTATVSHCPPLLLSLGPMHATSVVGHKKQGHQGRANRLLGRLAAVPLKRLQTGHSRDARELYLITNIGEVAPAHGQFVRCCRELYPA